jgi:excisionase family DNA binding protein
MRDESTTADAMSILGEIRDLLSVQSAELLGRDAVASLLSVSPRTVDQLHRRGEMPAPVLIGTRVLWRKSDLTKWISDGCRKPKRDGKRGSA